MKFNSVACLTYLSYPPTGTAMPRSKIRSQRRKFRTTSRQINNHKNRRILS